MVIDAERQEHLNASIAVFSWLSKAVDYPDEELVKALLEGEFKPNWPDEAAEGIQAYLNAFASADELLLDMQKEYTRMCFVSKPRLVPLFESVYKEGKLFQDSTFEIARLYNEAGIQLGEEFKLPPDHITLELEFMSYLIYQEREALKSGNEINEKLAVRLQQDTLDKHLVQFGISFGDRLSQNARTPIYQGIGGMLMNLFRLEFQPNPN